MIQPKEEKKLNFLEIIILIIFYKVSIRFNLLINMMIYLIIYFIKRIFILRSGAEIIDLTITYYFFCQNVFFVFFALTF